TRNEDWKFTNVAPIAKIPFRPADGEAGDGVSAEMLAGHLLGDAIQLVFVNGRYASELSSPRSLLGDLMVTNLAAALHAHPELVEPHLARYAAYESQAFTALNTAFMADGAFVYLPAEKVVETPIHLLFVVTAAGEGSVAQPRNLILAGAQSRATIVESYVGLEQEVYFTNVVTEVLAGAGAVIDHYKLQRESS